MLVDQWLAAGCPSGIASGMSLIAEDGSRFGGTPKWLRCQGERLEGMSPDELLKTQLSQSRIRFTGCSAAWSKENWSYFGPLAANVVAEDEVLSFRACLRGGVAFVAEELVDYRQHGSNLWNICKQKPWRDYKDIVRFEECRAKRFEYAIASCKNMLNDLSKCRGIIDTKLFDLLEGSLNERIENARIRSNWWKLSLRERLIHWGLFPHGSLLHRIAGLLPIGIYARLRLLIK
jgi:hypothetical protein